MPSITASATLPITLPTTSTTSSIEISTSPSPAASTTSNTTEFCFSLNSPMLNRHNSHPSQDLRELDPPTIDPRLHSAFRDLQDVDYFLIRQLLDVAQDNARL